MVFRLMTGKEVEKWYSDELCVTFAPQERKPLPDIFSLMAEKRYELWGLFDEETLLGYAALWKAPDVPLVLLDYLGVTESRRCGGLGAQILKYLGEQGRPVIVEAEEEIPGDREEENEIRRRRIGFYQRSGYVKVYRMATCGMAWQALLFGAESLSADDVMAWHRALYGPERTDVQVPLPQGEVPGMPYWMK